MDSAFIRETLQKQAPSAERILTEQPDYIRSSVVLKARQEDAPEQDIVQRSMRDRLRHACVCWRVRFLRPRPLPVDLGFQRETEERPHQHDQTEQAHAFPGQR